VSPFRCVSPFPEFEIGRAKNKICCSPECSKKNANKCALRYYHDGGGAERRDDRRARALRPIKAVGEWDGVALPPGVAKRLGL
jgi:hypothetical protein